MCCCLCNWYVGIFGLISVGAELLAAVQASLRRKAASLDEDNWIFEGEETKPGG